MIIVEFESESINPTNPPKIWLKYKQENETDFKKILVSYEQLKLFLETYGYETNSISELQKLNINVNGIIYNKNL